MHRSSVIILPFHGNSNNIPVDQGRQDRGRPVPSVVTDIAFPISTGTGDPIGEKLTVNVLLGRSGIVVASRGSRTVYINGAIVLPSFQ